MCLDVGLQNGVDSGLVAITTPFEPLHQVFVKPQGEMGFGGRYHGLRFFPELGIRGRNVRVIDLRVGRLPQLRPARSLPLRRGPDRFDAHACSFSGNTPMSRARLDILR